MKTYIDLKTSKRIGPAVGVMVFCALAAGATYADPSAMPVCNPLVTVSNNLLLVDSTGKVLTQFTSDGNSRFEAAISPDGSRVAYLTAAGSAASAFQVVDQYGRQGTFSVSATGHRDADRDPTFGFGANGSIQQLSWLSNRVLRVTKFAGKDVARFEFYGLPDDLAGHAYQAASPVLEQNCVAARKGGIAACIERQGNVTLDDGSATGQTLFSISGFEGSTPLQSFTLGVGDSEAPQNGLPFRVTIESVGNNQVALRLTPVDTGIWSQMQVASGSYMAGMDRHSGAIYGYFATIVNAVTGQVRIDVVSSNSPQYLFDPALAWQPRDQGLLFVRRTLSGAALDLVGPETSDDDDGHPQDHHVQASRNDDDRDGHGRGPNWQLVATAPVSLPGVVNTMRFVGSSMLLLQTADGNFSELPVQITHGQRDDHGPVTLTVGTLTALPQTIGVTISGATSQGKILGWSCQIPHPDDDN